MAVSGGASLAPVGPVGSVPPIAKPPTPAKLAPLPAPPAGGGHYVRVNGKPVVIHAIGPGKWAPGPPNKTAGAPRPGSAGPSGPNYNSALYNPSRTLTGKPLADAAAGIANAQIQGPVNALNATIGQRQAQTKAASGQTFGYYMQLAKAAQDAVGQQGSIGAGLNSTLAGIGQNTQSQLAQIGQQAQGGALGRAAALGLAGSAPADLAAQTAQQQGVGALNAQTFQARGASQGANYQANAANAVGVGALRGQERIGDIQRAGALAIQPLNTQIASWEGKRGALTASALGTLRGQERNYQVARAGLGIKAAGVQAGITKTKMNNATSLAVGAAHDAQSNTDNIRTNATNAASAAATNATNQSRDAANAVYHRALIDQGYAKLLAGNNKAMPPAANLKLLGQISKAVGLIQQGQTFSDSKLSNGKPNPNPLHPHGYTEAEQRANLAGTYNLSDPVIQAAFELLGYGALSPRTAAILHGLGMRGGSFRGRPIRVGR